MSVKEAHEHYKRLLNLESICVI